MHQDPLLVYLFQANLRQVHGWPVATTTTADRIRQMDRLVPSTTSSSETSSHMRLQSSTSRGTLEEQCSLGNHDIAKLSGIFSHLTEGHGIMVHHSNSLGGSPAVARTSSPPHMSVNPTKSTCPYNFTLVYMGNNAYPSRIMNATSNCEVCRNGESDPTLPMLPRTTCMPTPVLLHTYH